MNKQLLIELVAALAKRLDRGHRQRADYLPHEEDISLGLAEEVRKILRPVKPAVSFRKDLRSRLEIIAQKRVILEPRHRRPWLFFLVAAALGSTLSALGLLAYFLTSRFKRPQPTS